MICLRDADLAKVREEFRKNLKESSDFSSYKKELKRLEENEYVKRYLELLELVDRDDKEPTVEELVSLAYQNANVSIRDEDSNHIMVYVGTYCKDTDMHHDNDSLTLNDSNASYKAYLDLETQQAYNIAMDKTEEFEREFLTLYLPIENKLDHHDYMSQYFELQTWFKKELMQTPQDMVIKKLQIIGKIRKSEDANSFDVSLFVRAYGDDYYLEKFGLSHKNREKVKRYKVEHPEFC